MQKFEVKFAGSYRRIIMLVVSFVCLFAGLLILAFKMRPQYVIKDPGAVWMIDVTIIFMMGAIVWWLIFDFGLMVREFFQCSFTVAVDDKELIGYNLWKQPKYLNLLDIVAVRPAKKIPWSKLPPNLEFSSANGQTICIHSNIEPLGRCVESIVAKCPNLVAKDYGGLDKDERIWSGEDKL